jgi:hypothetical protein
LPEAEAAHLSPDASLETTDDLKEKGKMKQMKKHVLKQNPMKKRFCTGTVNYNSKSNN